MSCPQVLSCQSINFYNSCLRLTLAGNKDVSYKLLSRCLQQCSFNELNNTHFVMHVVKCLRLEMVFKQSVKSAIGIVFHQ